MEPAHYSRSKWCLAPFSLIAVRLDKITHRKLWKDVLCCRTGHQHKIRYVEKQRRDRVMATNWVVVDSTPAKKRKVDESTPGGSGFQRPLDGTSGNQIDWLGRIRKIFIDFFSFLKSLYWVWSRSAS